MPDDIGFIGLGVMGRPMAAHLLTKGHRLIVHNRSQPPIDELVAAGAIAAKTPAEVAERSAIVITMLPDTPDDTQVLTGPDGVVGSLRRGSIVIDMSTISPVATRRLASRVASTGAT